MTRALRVLVVLAITGSAWLAASVPAHATVGVPVIIDSFGNPNLDAGLFTRTVIPLPLPHTSTTPQGSVLRVRRPRHDDHVRPGQRHQRDHAPLHARPRRLGRPDGRRQQRADLHRFRGHLRRSRSHHVHDRHRRQWRRGHLARRRHRQHLRLQRGLPVHRLQGRRRLQPDHRDRGELRLPGDQHGRRQPAGAGQQVLGAVVDLTAAFTSNEGKAPVTNSPPSDIGVRAQDLVVGGTAFGDATPKVVVTGGPSNYKVSVSGMIRSGTITAHVPAEIVSDAWRQLNTASANDPTVDFTFAIPPKFQGPDTKTFTVGASDTFTADANAGSPTPVPTPALSIANGVLPSGLTFDDNGDGTATIAGKPAPGTGGVVPLLLFAISDGAATPRGRGAGAIGAFG